MAKRSQLDKAMDYACAELERVGDLEMLPKVVRTVAIVQAAQGIIDNGGLQYFFESDFPNQPPYAIFVDAYREIGAIAEADALAAAVSLFPFAEPHKNQTARDKFLVDLGQDLRSPMWDFDGKLCGSEEVWRLLASYVGRNPRSFSK
jgi:Domain of unknown function (DUF4375)